MEKRSVLIVDDDRNFLAETKEALSSNGYRVLTAGTAAEAKEKLKETCPSVVLLDRRLPDMDGQALIKAIKKVSKKINIIIVTAYTSTESFTEGVKDGITDYISKPVDPEILMIKIDQILKREEKIEKECKKLKLWGKIQLKKYKTLFDNANDAIFIADPLSGTLLDCNKSALRLMGYKKEEIIGKSQAVIHPKDQGEKYKTMFREHVEGKKAFEESAVLTKKGEIVPVAISARVVKIDGIKYIQGIFHDMRDLKKAQGEVERAFKQIELFSQITPSAIFTVDTERHITSWNKAAEELTGYASGEVMGKKCGLFSRYPCEQNCPLYAADIEKPIYTKEHMIETKDGRTAIILKSMDLLKNEKGEVIGGIESFADITDKRVLEDELRRHSEHLEEEVEQRTKKLAAAMSLLEEANRKLKRYDELKSQFVANVGHELLNPLTVIKEALELAVNGKIATSEEKEKRFLDISKRQIEKLQRFVKNMLDLSKIEAGKMPASFHQIDLKRLLNDNTVFFMSECKKKGIIFTSDIEKSPETITADDVLINEVIRNLLSNALKYSSPGGRISFKAFKEEGWFRIEVKDQGPGIPSHLHEKIFDKFYRVLKEKEEGTGLGLSIVKEIVNLHKGKVWVESEPAKGATFIVAIPTNLKKEEGSS